MNAHKHSSDSREALLERRLSRAQRALHEAETALESRMRELAKANLALKQREEELAERLELENRQLLSAQRVGGFATIVGIPGQPFQSSPELNSVLGYPLGMRLEPEHVIARIHSLDRRRMIEETERFYTALSKDEDHEFAHRINHPTKGVRWLQWYIRRSSGDTGEAKSILGTVRDITERRNTERQVRALQLRAERRVRELDRLTRELEVERGRAQTALDVRTRFLSTMAHQFRTPLATLSGLIDMLVDQDIDEELRRQMILAERSTERISSLLDEALAEADGSSNSVALFSAPVATEGFFKDSLRFWNTSLGENGRENLKLILSQNLPARVEADAVRLRELFDNLVGFGLETCGAIEVGAHWTDCLLITMRPMGMKCPPASEEMIGGDPQMRRVMQLADAMNGSVNFDAEQSKLVTALRLRPLEDGSAVPDAPLMTQQGGKPQVLLAEDTESNRAIIAAILESLGCEVQTAVNGAEAFEAATSRRFDAVLMDVMMPVMDGEEAVRRIRSSEEPYSRTPVIGVTAHTMQEERERLLAAGMSACLSKPVRKMELRSALRTALGATSTEESKAAKFDLNQYTVAFEAVPAHYRLRFVEAVETDLRNYGKKLVCALEASDAVEAEKNAHALKGVAGNIGAKVLLDEIAELRDRLANGQSVSSSEIDKLIEETCIACRELFEARFGDS